MSQPTTVQIQTIWNQAKQISQNGDTAVLLDCIKANPDILYLWVLPSQSIEDYSVHVKIIDDLDDDFREGEELMQEYEPIEVPIDTSFLNYLLVRSDIPSDVVRFMK